MLGELVSPPPEACPGRMRPQAAVARTSVIGIAGESQVRRDWKRKSEKTVKSMKRRRL